MGHTIYDFREYKDYLRFIVGPRSQRRGLKSEIAKALRCQPTYISQVLHGKAHLSLEQADALNTFFGHSKDESTFFILMVQKDRAGTISLRNHFEDQLEQLTKKRMSVSERLGPQHKLSQQDQTRYYTSWHYAAIHIALTIPALKNPKAIADFFKLPIKKVNQVLEFLISMGLAQKDDVNLYTVGLNQVRLGNDSPNILRHHANWRQQAIESLDREEIEDLHYSSVVSLSKEDVIKIKDKMLEQLKENLKLIKASPEEELFSYCIDFFRLNR